MRIAFYAPMKPPDSQVPSGDRAMARLLVAALEKAGHEVELAARFSSREPKGDPDAQARLRSVGGDLARRCARRYRARPRDERPDLWLTYHVYYKAPDWLGPSVARACGMPYAVAEASHAPKRAGGPWAIGHDGAEAAIRAADAIIGLNSNDLACVAPLAKHERVIAPMAPFIDLSPYAGVAPRTEDAAPRLLCVAMMRLGDKLDSYRVLAEALKLLADKPWTLEIAGDGPARSEVEALFARFGSDRVRFFGRVEPEDLPALYGKADLYVWPAVREAFGIAILEAQAAGLPVIAGDAGGVGDIVTHETTGLLTKEGDARGFAAAVQRLIEDRARRRAMANAARAKTRDQHGLEAASGRLDAILRALTEEGAPCRV